MAGGNAFLRVSFEQFPLYCPLCRKKHWDSSSRKFRGEGGRAEPRALLSTLPSCPRGIVHRIPERIRAHLSLPKESLVRNLTSVINPKDSVGICHLEKTNGRGYSE